MARVNVMRSDPNKSEHIHTNDAEDHVVSLSSGYRARS